MSISKLSNIESSSGIQAAPLQKSNSSYWGSFCSRISNYFSRTKTAFETQLTDLQIAVRSPAFTYRDIICNKSLKAALVNDIESSDLLFEKRREEIRELELSRSPNTERSWDFLRKDRAALRKQQVTAQISKQKESLERHKQREAEINKQLKDLRSRIEIAGLYCM